MRLRNSTNIPNETAKEIIRFVRPAGISRFDVEVRNSRSAYAGRAYHQGSGYHDRAAPFIVVRIGPDKLFPSHSEAHGGYLRIAMGNRIEAMVVVLAHELRHLWQAANPLRGKRRGMVYGARGRFSERDADAYALHKLREWRRR